MHASIATEFRPFKTVCAPGKDNDEKEREKKKKDKNKLLVRAPRDSSGYRDLIDSVLFYDKIRGYECVYLKNIKKKKEKVR